MRKSLSVFSVSLAPQCRYRPVRSTGTSCPAPVGEQPVPEPGPASRAGDPAVVTISVSGKKITRQRLPEQFRFLLRPQHA